MARGRRLLGMAAGMLLVGTGSAAAAAQPRGGYAVFAQCPTQAKHVNGCVYGRLYEGYITLGRTGVPVTKTIVLQAGTLRETEPFVKQLVGALDGETLAKVGQPLFGLPISVVPELAAPPSAIFVHTKPLSLMLPVKFRLESTFLPVACLIGSDADPIRLLLTTGSTGGGLKGNAGVESPLEGGGIDLISGVVMVDRGFAAPGAQGCGSSGAIDTLIDDDLGLPSSDNTVVFDESLEIANSELVEGAES
jgi:hypothetical protein